ncbi:hypothetical protein QU487_03090 [Crenobacter sp. SG2305]|uniref:DUF6708 domain-containing protein n=1 Tax=Crenobacter oryzisoli TaxID=3056844 RepID=UPI0025AABDC0|nr:DUF6708 domain-containing protein [Crenobacter sp. SG2305]MDN0081748.1 hypothetical protein [Crenobacter sp. SG2305]
MYYMEWIQAMGRRKHKPGSWMDKVQQKTAADDAAFAQKMRAKGVRYGLDFREVDVTESRSATVDDNGAIYRKTTSCLDVCTYNDDKRGLLTLVLSVFCYALFFCAEFLVELLGQLITGRDYFGAELIPDAGFWFALIVSLVITPLLFYAFFRYLARFWRLEAFTMRRLVVRFNRDTRKVYFLRPAFLGGVKAYDWEIIDAGLPKDMPNHEGVGGMLVLVAKAEENDNPHMAFAVDGAFVGNACRDYQQLLSFWEYIRRFMEDGPDAVPEPRRRRRKWPNPLASMGTVSRLSLPGGFDLGRRLLWLRLVLTPVFVIWGLGHYASLLLCCEPRFPKAIRAASHESEARSLLALLGYNLLPPLYTAAGLWLYYAWQHDLDWRLPLQSLGWG